jgi:hypothetical protein
MANHCKAGLALAVVLASPAFGAEPPLAFKNLALGVSEADAMMIYGTLFCDGVPARRRCIMRQAEKGGGVQESIGGAQLTQMLLRFHDDKLGSISLMTKRSDFPKASFAIQQRYGMPAKPERGSTELRWIRDNGMIRVALRGADCIVTYISPAGAIAFGQDAEGDRKKAASDLQEEKGSK